MTSKTAYFRTAVTRSDLTGKTWQPIILHEDLSALEQRGFLSEGAVCYCGELDKYCALHDDGRHRSSTTTSSSSTIMEYEEEDNLPSFYSLSSHLDATPPAWSHFAVEDDNVIFEQSDDSPPSPNDEKILFQVQSLAAYQIASNQTNNKQGYETNIRTKTTEESHDDLSLLASTLVHQSSDVLTAIPHSSSSSCQENAPITSTSDVLTAPPHLSSSSCQENASITSTSDVLTAAPHSSSSSCQENASITSTSVLTAPPHLSSSSCQENASITSTSDQSSEIVQCVSYENLALCKDISKPENKVTSDATLNSSISKLLMNIHSSLPTAVLCHDTNTQVVDKHFHNTLQGEATQNLKSLCPDLNTHSSLPTDVLCHETNTQDIDKHFHTKLQGGETESLKSLCLDLKGTIILDAPSSPSEKQSTDLQEKKSLRPQRKKLVSSSNDNDIVFERLKGKRKVRRKSSVSTENNVVNGSPSGDTQLASSDSQLSLDTYSFSFSLTNNSISSDSTSQGSTCSDSVSQDSTCSDSSSQDSTSPVLNSQDPNSQPHPDLDVIDYLPPSTNYFTDIANFTGDLNMHSMPFLSVDYYSGETPLSEHQDIHLNSSQESTNVSTPNVESVQTGLPANSDLVSIQTALPINSDLVSVQPAVIANGDVEYYSLTKDSHQLLSLDSNSYADDIINFATDIISEEEKSRQAISFQPVEVIEYDVERTVTASQPSINILTDSQVGVGDFDLTAVEFTNGQLRDYLPLAELHPSRKLSKYRKSPSLQSPVTKTEINTITQVSVAQPRLCWKWLDATSCVIDNPASVAWLSSTNKESEPAQKVSKISQSLRDDIMRKLVKRNERESQGFKQLELAINRTTWVKKANMQMYRYDRRHHWVPCSVEFEQAITKNSEGCLTVHYQHKKTQKHTQIPLSEMTCVRTCFDLDQPSTLNIHTAMSTIIHQPLVLKANSESEADEWMGHLCAAKASVLNINNAISPGSVWSCTFTGDVFVSPASSTYRKSFDLCWGQHGGHMALVETGPSGVTWGIGFDKIPHVYNNGYGGAVTCGSSAMSDNTMPITDYQHMYVYENEKWFPVVGWCCKGVFTDDFHWLTESGRSVASKDSVTLPSSKWEWTSDWTIDFSTPGGVDKNGWQYSNYLYGPFHSRLHMRDSYRRRRWTRRCRLSYLGPWQTEDSLGLVDISVQIDPLDKDTDTVVVWAVGATGEVVYRSGVTSMQPMGQSWVHVATDMDKPFKSISIGGKYRVWGIASDGSAWFRTGVSPSNPAGTCWLLVVPPPECDFLLHQVSAGATTVWAVDTGDNLWHRQNITPTFPEGTGWEKVASRVKRVCVGPKDETWIVTDALFSKAKHGPGVVYKRLGISPSKPTGTDWEVVIGSGWAHVSIRGLREDGNKSGNDEDSWD
ncbi:unnamed protein product [Lymnaea stagnalis]|uniref:Tectonin beta-propeller repeat-containing protein 1 n=1 Tax=Lymnaea stagnalis TaxID=6523 RepID=A0AAV2IQ60_LYMST